MHRIESRSYVGQAREVVTITTRVTGGGQAAVIVDGVDMGQQADFQLPDNLGDRIKWQIALMGPLGATCVVGIAVVDGSADGDFLICQAHNPAPVHFYTCSVIQAPEMRALRGIRRTKVATRARGRRTAARKSSKKAATRKKTVSGKTFKTKKVASKRAGRKKTAARKPARTAKKGGRS
jgi:hypothetical protein